MTMEATPAEPREAAAHRASAASASATAAAGHRLAGLAGAPGVAYGASNAAPPASLLRGGQQQLQGQFQHAGVAGAAGGTGVGGTTTGAATMAAMAGVAMGRGRGEGSASAQQAAQAHDDAAQEGVIQRALRWHRQAGGGGAGAVGGSRLGQLPVAAAAVEGTSTGRMDAKVDMDRMDARMVGGGVGTNNMGMGTNTGMGMAGMAPTTPMTPAQTMASMAMAAGIGSGASYLGFNTNGLGNGVDNRIGTNGVAAGMGMGMGTGTNMSMGGIGTPSSLGGSAPGGAASAFPRRVSTPSLGTNADAIKQALAAHHQRRGSPPGVVFGRTTPSTNAMAPSPQGGMYPRAVSDVAAAPGGGTSLGVGEAPRRGSAPPTPTATAGAVAAAASNEGAPGAAGPQRAAAGCEFFSAGRTSWASATSASGSASTSSTNQTTQASAPGLAQAPGPSMGNKELTQEAARRGQQATDATQEVTNKLLAAAQERLKLQEASWAARQLGWQSQQQQMLTQQQQMQMQTQAARGIFASALANRETNTVPAPAPTAAPALAPAPPAPLAARGASPPDGAATMAQPPPRPPPLPAPAAAGGNATANPASATAPARAMTAAAPTAAPTTAAALNPAAHANFSVLGEAAAAVARRLAQRSQDAEDIETALRRASASAISASSTKGDADANGANADRAAKQKGGVRDGAEEDQRRGKQENDDDDDDGSDGDERPTTTAPVAAAAPIAAAAAAVTANANANANINGSAAAGGAAKTAAAANNNRAAAPPPALVAPPTVAAGGGGREGGGGIAVLAGLAPAFAAAAAAAPIAAGAPTAAGAGAGAAGGIAGGAARMAANGAFLAASFLAGANANANNAAAIADANANANHPMTLGPHPAPPPPPPPPLDGPEAPPPRLTVRRYARRGGGGENSNNVMGNNGRGGATKALLAPAAAGNNVGDGGDAATTTTATPKAKRGRGAGQQGQQQQQQPRPPRRKETVERTASRRDEGRWLERFEELRAFRDKRGDCNVPQKYSANPILARWVSQQRVEYKKLVAGEESSITRERVGALDAIGFEWNALDAAWSRKFDDLRRYRSENGHCDVPLRYPSDPSLGRWVVRQRHERRNLLEGKPSQLTEARVAALEGLGLEWDTRDREWEKRLGQLRSYKERNGHCDVPYVYEENRQLGHWVRNQRTQYSLRRAGKRHRLTNKRLEKLEALGFAWCVMTNKESGGRGGEGSSSDEEEDKRTNGKVKGGRRGSISDDDEEEEEEGAFNEMLSVDDEVRKPFVNAVKKKLGSKTEVVDEDDAMDLSVDDDCVKPMDKQLRADGGRLAARPQPPTHNKFGSLNLKRKSISERLSVDESVNRPAPAVKLSFARWPSGAGWGVTNVATAAASLVKQRYEEEQLGVDDSVNLPAASTNSNLAASSSVRQRYEEEQLGVDDSVNMPAANSGYESDDSDSDSDEDLCLDSSVNKPPPK